MCYYYWFLMETAALMDSRLCLFGSSLEVWGKKYARGAEARSATSWVVKKFRRVFMLVISKKHTICCEL